MKVAGIQHITIRVQDQEASKKWYEEVLGLEFMAIPVGGDVTKDWRGRPSEGKLYATQAGTTFFILAPPLDGTADGDRFSEYRIGVDHMAFAIEDRSELDSLVERLRAAGVHTEGVETDPVLNKEYVAFRDPDNVQCEAYMA